VDDIILHWSCGQSTCPNERGFCYIVDGVHLRLLAQHMKTWSMAINQQEGDIDMMPAALAKTLMPAKLRTKNPLRENAAKPLDTVATHSAAANHPAPLPPSPGSMNPFTTFLHHTTVLIMVSIISWDIHRPLNKPFHHPSAPDVTHPHFHPNLTHPSINSLTTLHGSSNGIPLSPNNSPHA